MKKYLMIGIAAVAMTAAFTSCSKDKDIEQISQVQLDESKYQAAFESRFGTIAPNHDWGFNQFKKGAAARTRAAEINVNGNLWQSCPTLGETEETDVVTYVTNLATKPNTNPIDLKNYYVTQVHCGTETYTNGDGSAGIKGSAHMDNLQILMTDGGTITSAGALSGDWMHINNFNRGDNTDWQGNTLVTGGGTYDFAYNCSEDSKYHNRWIAIDGKDIDATKYAGYYYVCFDFEATVDGYTMLTNASYFNPYLDNGHGQWLNFNNIKLPGNWTAEAVASSDLVYTVDLYDQNNNFKETKTFHFNNPNEIKNISVGNYVGGNMEIIPNSSYLDWIIRLVKAEPVGGDGDDDDDDDDDDFPKADVRVFVEDMSAAEEWDGVKFTGDFDFNDVVFDVVYNYKGKSAIILQAAGGTLPLYVADHEVHEAFGVGTSDMVNTGWGPNRKPVLIPLDVSYDDANDIPVVVYKNNQDFPLEAGVGKAPHKLAVVPNLEWAGERDDIEGKYPLFLQWVKNPQTRWYE